jgi:glutaredoxin-related protein
MEKCPKISHKDKKYLRVCYEVMCSYLKATCNYKKEMVRAARKKAQAMKQTVKILKEIRDAIQDQVAIDTAPQVVITDIFYKGEVKRVQSDEYIEITNQSDTPADLTGWSIHADDPGQDFRFPAGTVYHLNGLSECIPMKYTPKPADSPSA